MKYSQSESFALGQWLSDWPTDWSYNRVIKHLQSRTWIGADSPITVWEVVENNTGDQIADFIESTRDCFEQYKKEWEAENGKLN